jgi:integrase
MTATLQIKKNRPNYYVIIRYKDETTGKERQKCVTTDLPVKGNNKRKAEKCKDEILAQYIRDGIDVGKDAFFIEFIISYLKQLLGSKNIALTTYEAYIMTLDVHIIPFFKPLDLKIKEIEPRHIQKYINKKLEKLSPNTVKKHMAIIDGCLDSAVRQNIIAFNPAKRVETIHKVKYTGAKFLNEQQIDRLLDVSKGDPLEIVIFLTLFYGLRRSEILGMKWSAIDFDNDMISINHTVIKVNKTIHYKDSTKNESSNDTLPMPEMVKTHLKQWKAKQIEWRLLQPNDYIESGYVCTMINGSLMKPDYVSHHFKVILVKNNIMPVRFHDLRHSAGSYLHYLGFDIKDIQTWLRHADIQSTSLYTHMDMDGKREIAEKLNTRISNLSGFASA